MANAPTGTAFDSFKGHPMITFPCDAARPPQFGLGKAKAIVLLSDAGVDAQTIVTAAGGFGVRNLDKIDAELIVNGARALVEKENKQAA